MRQACRVALQMLLALVIAAMMPGNTRLKADRPNTVDGHIQPSTNDAGRPPAWRSLGKSPSAAHRATCPIELTTGHNPCSRKSGRLRPNLKPTATLVGRNDGFTRRLPDLCGAFRTPMLSSGKFAEMGVPKTDMP